jgi:OPA family glycerol-3-phosphate transporter-like MFS transporter
VATPLTAAHRLWRARVFASTYLSYVAFYFCRRPFNSAKKSILADHPGWTQTTVGNIYAAYLFAYAVGQFLASGMGTKLGPRVNVLLGMAISLVATLAMGVDADPLVLGGVMLVNGLAQATGWSGNVGTMASWFHKHERGRVMGFWSTNFNIGALVAGWTMAAVLEFADWQWCFYVGAFVMAVAWTVFFLFQRNRPEDVGLLPIDDPATAVERSGSAGQRSNAERCGDPIDEATTPDPPPTGFLGLSGGQWTNLMLVAGFYFFAKFIRYAIWSWAPYFLQTHYLLDPGPANWYATAFDFLGLPGVVLTGYASDLWFGSRRAGISAVLMLCATFATLGMWVMAAAGVPVFVVLLATIGFFAYGPDALLTGAGAMDIGGRRAATFAAAVISGFGSMGSIVQELVIARVYDPKTDNLSVVFLLLLGSAACATGFCVALVWRNRSGRGV